MLYKILRRLLFFLPIFFVVSLLVVTSVPARADGGIVAQRNVWECIGEGHQVAVITLLNKNTAKIELFVSILDSTTESHEVVFFVPLGMKPQGFSAVEYDLNEFDNKNIRNLNEILRDSARAKQWSVHTMFAGAILTNGFILVPLWAPMLLTGCAPSAMKPEPEAVYKTEHSKIKIYGLNEDSNIEALINTTGLDQSVQDTLSSLRGQRIAIVNLNTNPQSSPYYSSSGIDTELGICLSWTTSLTPAGAGGKYSYPLGTGASWPRPIELTRVYIVAPTGLDFDINYPQWGADRSGYVLGKGYRITDYYQIPAYAVDEARGSYGRVCRLTYTQSNVGEDIVIETKPQSTMSKILASLEESSASLAVLFALIIGLLFWILSWHYLMPRFTGLTTAQNKLLHWYYGLIYPAINTGLILIPGSILFGIFTASRSVLPLALLFLICAGISIVAYDNIHARELGISRGKALSAFILVSLVSNSGYLILAFIYTKLVGLL